MKKSLAVLLALAVSITSVFVACAHKDEKNVNAKSTEPQGLEAADTEIGFEEIEVTDDKGKTVTDADGNKVTTEVAVVYSRDSKGKTVAKVLGADGEVVTDSKGKEVTVKTDVELDDDVILGGDDTTKTTKEKKTTASTTLTQKNEQTTEAEVTTKEDDKDYSEVPLTTDKATAAAAFDAEDQNIIKQMLEVPYLYNASYENSQGVPVEIATHAAIWMAQREGLPGTTYASGTVVIGLFKYFGQTVVNFKANCNLVSGAGITYMSNNDNFTIGGAENDTHEVTLTSIQRFGKSNYYKITGDVNVYKNSSDDGEQKTPKVKKVTAIVQRNKLDLSLGFSIKALKWQ